MVNKEDPRSSMDVGFGELEKADSETRKSFLELYESMPMMSSMVQTTQVNNGIMAMPERAVVEFEAYESGFDDSIEGLTLTEFTDY